MNSFPCVEQNRNPVGKAVVNPPFWKPVWKVEGFYAREDSSVFFWPYGHQKWQTGIHFPHVSTEVAGMTWIISDGWTKSGSSCWQLSPWMVLKPSAKHSSIDKPKLEINHAMSLEVNTEINYTFSKVQFSSIFPSLGSPLRRSFPLMTTRRCLRWSFNFKDLSSIDLVDRFIWENNSRIEWVIRGIEALLNIGTSFWAECLFFGMTWMFDSSVFGSNCCFGVGAQKFAPALTKWYGKQQLWINFRGSLQMMVMKRLQRLEHGFELVYWSANFCVQK